MNWKQYQEQVLTHRLVDVFGLFDYLIELQSEAAKQLAQEAEAKKKLEELSQAEARALKKKLANQKAADKRAKAKMSKLAEPKAALESNDADEK